VGTAALMINALNNVIPPGELNMQKNWIRGGVVAINTLGVDNTTRLAGAFESSDGSQIINNWFK
jgi:hypothetical protein